MNEEELTHDISADEYIDIEAVLLERDIYEYERAIPNVYDRNENLRINRG